MLRAAHQHHLEPAPLALSGRAPAGGTVIYSATGLPAGLGINMTTGLISGPLAPDAHTNSPYTVTVTAG